MSVYFIKGKGWRYELPLNGTRYTGAWFKTKREAKKAKAEREEVLTKPTSLEIVGTIPIDMEFSDLLNRRLDHVKVYCYRFWSQTKEDWVVGPYKERKRIMRALCNKAGVKYFRYHALRHFGASILEQANVPVGSI